MANDNRIAVVTGASRGAGAGIARALGSHGCTVYVTGRTRSGAGTHRARHHRRDGRPGDRRGR